MAKKRDITISTLKCVNDQLQIVARVNHSCKMDDTDTPQDHTTNFDLLVSLKDFVAKTFSTLVIDWQKIGRTSGSHAKMRILEAEPVTWPILYPGVRAVRVSIARDMTPDEIRAKCKSDKAFRSALMAELEAMEDEDATEGDNDTPELSAAQAVDVKVA